MRDVSCQLLGGGSGCGRWCARATEGAEELGDGGRVGEDGADGELASASGEKEKLAVSEGEGAAGVQWTDRLLCDLR